MKTITRYALAPAVLATLILGACATTTPTTNNPYSSAPAQNQAYSGYGVVQSIELVKQDGSGDTSSHVGLGTIAGAVVGGALGSQVGSGRGSTAATVVGAAGGAYVGHEMENRPQQAKADAYKITVRMDDGSYQAVILSTNGGFRVGDRVRVENGILQRY